MRYCCKERAQHPERERKGQDGVTDDDAQQRIGETEAVDDHVDGHKQHDGRENVAQQSADEEDALARKLEASDGVASQRPKDQADGRCRCTDDEAVPEEREGIRLVNQVAVPVERELGGQQLRW